MNSPTTANRRVWPLWLLLALVLALSVGTLVLYVVNRNTVVPASWGTLGGSRANLPALINVLLIGVAVPLLTTALGVLIVSRQGRNRVGWLMVLVGTLYLLIPLLSELTVYMNLSAAAPLAGGQIVAWVSNWVWIIVYALLVLLMAVFPDGHILTRNWTLAIGIPLAIFTGCLLIAAAIEQPMSSAYQVSNPFVASHPGSIYNALFAIGVPMMPLMLLVVLGEVAARYRRSGLVEKQQIKWLLVGLAATALLVVLGLALAFAADLPYGALLVNAAPILPVLAIGFAMLRYRLYDIDLVLRRTVSYALLTAVLLLVYFGSVTLLTSLFSRVTGQQSALAIVISTLLIAALFNPLRRRVQHAIDRRFFRSSYDAQEVLEEFARKARDETDLDALLAEMVRVVQDTMRPEHVSVWLRKPDAGE
ncbi:MAG: hypothetical protein R2844_00430 [Caldilineales bacterium]